MEGTKRQLGWKNYRLFIVLVVVVGFVVALFAFSIFVIGRNEEVYSVAAGSTVIDKNYNVVSLANNGQIRKSFTGDFSLQTVDENGNSAQYDLGKNSVAYSDFDYKFYLYGQAYLINNDTSVKKINQYEEISKATPSFYKLADRKYLLADKLIEAKEIGLKTDGYLLVNLDRQGDATLVNDEVNIKTINPIIIKGTYYDFDVAHEKLIIGGTEIDLANVIGTTNEFDDTIASDSGTSDGGENTGGTGGTSGDASRLVTAYYDNYIQRIKNSFNSLYGATSAMNDNLENVAKKTNVALDLTRWTNLTAVTADPTTITVNYSVFDPNNEYTRIFLTLSEYGSAVENKYILSKENTSFTIRDLKPDTKYVVGYGYALAKIVDESQAEVSIDTVTIVTPIPKLSISINKITTNKVYYVLKLDKGYAISQAEIQLISDGVVIGSTVYDASMATDYMYEGSFSYDSLGKDVEVRASQLVYNGVVLDGTISGRYINE